ncbi:MAG: hypothetical protein K8L91_08080 [Anaerolineae bacterium]|nr:hypothetical protein [Anaerolineae bacterium]
MLENVAKINWNDLEDAYGPATQIPFFLQDLTSQETTKWAKAIFNLYMGICHQGVSIYEATSYTVPFLIELLQSDSIKCREHIFRLLGDISGANAESYSLTNQVKERVWEGLEIYLKLINDVNPVMRIIAPFTLSMLLKYAYENISPDKNPEQVLETITNMMLEQYTSEIEPLVKASLLFGLRYSYEKGSLTPDFFYNMFLSETNVQAKTAAAICFAETNHNFSEDIIVFLAEALKNIEETERLFELTTDSIQEKNLQTIVSIPSKAHLDSYPDDLDTQSYIVFPWSEICHRFNLVTLLCKTAPSQINALITSFLRIIEIDNEYSMEYLTTPIVKYVFQGQHVLINFTVEELSTYQHAILKQIYDNPFLWIGSNSSRRELFNELGLSESRDQWAKVLNTDLIPVSEKQAEEILLKIVRNKLNLRSDELITQEHFFKIKTLRLRNIGSDAFVPFIHRFLDLYELDLSQSDVTMEGILLLPIIESLHVLNLKGISLDEKAIRHISNLKNLESLNLSSTGFHEDWLVHLHQFKYLKKLFISNNQNISKGAVQELKSTVPFCKINI